MMLLTKEIKQQLPKLYATDGIPAEEKKVICKFFTPWSNWSWYVVEGEKQGDDYTFFGYVCGMYSEYGYFTLKQLQEIEGPLGLKIERDRHIQKDLTIADVMTQERNV